MNVLFVGAHPDDIELGGGGTLVKHLEKGDEVYVLVMSNGEKGNHSKNREECFDSLRTMGVSDSNIVFGNFPDGSITDDYQTVNFIESYIKIFKITRVYTHPTTDRHQDHRNLSLSVSSAARNIPELFLFQGPSNTVSFEPHIFIELSEEHLNKKIKGLSCYKSQVEKGVVNIEWVKSIASVNGNGMKGKYAEAFALNHFYMEGENV
ncbi:MAG: PIG-L deacetylase family protein [archaeon]